MTEKISPDKFSPDLLTVVKPNHGRTLPQVAGLWNDASLSLIRAGEHAQPAATDLRMVVRIQRKNKHPHSTKKHK
jgi:hypothetical protein